MAKPGSIQITRRQALAALGVAALGMLGVCAHKNEALKNEPQHEFAKRAADPIIQGKYSREVIEIQAAVERAGLDKGALIRSKDTIKLISYLSKLETEMTGGYDNTIPISEWGAARNFGFNSGGHSYGPLQIQPGAAKEIFIKYFDALQDCPFFASAKVDINGRQRPALSIEEIRKLSPTDTINALNVEAWGGILLGLVKFLDHQKDCVLQCSTAVATIRRSTNSTVFGYDRYTDSINKVCGIRGIRGRVRARLRVVDTIGVGDKRLTVPKVPFQNAMAAYCAGNNATAVSSIQAMLTDAAMFHSELKLKPVTIDGSYGRETAKSFASYLGVSVTEVAPAIVRANPQEFLQRAFQRWMELEGIKEQQPKGLNDTDPRSMNSFFHDLRAQARKGDSSYVFGRMKWLILAGYTGELKDGNKDRLLAQSNCARVGYLIAFGRAYLETTDDPQAKEQFRDAYKKYLENRDYSVIKDYVHKDIIPSEKLEEFADIFTRAAYQCIITENVVGVAPSYYKDKGGGGKTNALMRAIIPFNKMEL